MRDLGDSPVPVTIAITDRIRDLMVMTVPELARDELESLVEPDVPMRDDGCTGIFVKAFIYDDMPVIEVDDDLGAVMSLTDPTLIGAVDLPVRDVPLPLSDDGLEQAWFDAVRYAVPEFPVAIAAPAEVLRLEASAEVLGICAPAVVPSVCAPTEMLSILPPASVPSIASPCVVADAEGESSSEEIIGTAEDIVHAVPLVTFSFGPSAVDAGGWKVSFTF